MAAGVAGSDDPVIVVGAGPVGMTAAAVLAQHAVPTIVIESEPVPRTDWRASTFHAATLELLDQIGVAEQMHREGLTVPTFQFRDRVDGLVAELDFGLLADQTRYPYRLQLNQQHLVRMLHERLRADPQVRLLFGTSVTGLTNAPGGGVTVALAGAGAGEGSLRGSHVIGADGAGSVVRRSLGADFEGYTYPERFMIVSTSVDLRAQMPDLADVNYVADPREWLFLLRTPESWRVVWAVRTGVSEQEATLPEVMQERLQGMAPLPGGYPIIDQQIYRVHQRVASTFRVGDVAIVGDAAHVNSPIGGVGLNSGIHDAVDLTTRIVRIRTGQATDPDAELATFASIRRQVAIEYVQADTQRNTERLAETDERRRRANQAELCAVAADPERARAWLRRASLLESVQRFGIGRPPSEHASLGSG